MNLWPFHRQHKKPSRNPEIDRLQSAVSNKRNELYKNLLKLDDATKSLEAEGVRGMLGEMFQRLEEGKRRD